MAEKLVLITLVFLSYLLAAESLVFIVGCSSMSQKILFHRRQPAKSEGNKLTIDVIINITNNCKMQIKSDTIYEANEN